MDSLGFAQFAEQNQQIEDNILDFERSSLFYPTSGVFKWETVGHDRQPQCVTGLIEKI